jgi:hypothetical protein
VFANLVVCFLFFFFVFVFEVSGPNQIFSFKKILIIILPDNPVPTRTSGVIWMGAARSLTRLHFDDDPVAVLHQLSGRKVVIGV